MKTSEFPSPSDLPSQENVDTFNTNDCQSMANLKPDTTDKALPDTNAIFKIELSKDTLTLTTDQLEANVNNKIDNPNDVSCDGPQTNLKQIEDVGQYYDYERFEDLSDVKDSQIRAQENKSEPEQITNAHTDSTAWSQSQWMIFKTVVFETIKQYFKVQFQTLEEALVHYRNCIVGSENGKATKIHLNFKQIANDSDMITEKECRQKFQTLLENTLQSWPQERVEAVKTRILELWQQVQEPEIAQRKKLIKAMIEEEFQLKQQVQFKYKEMQNKINYILKNLK
ncbi:Hypothetical_protein [Hexamita inflata]|uniref:Hypothetical_protein n=1 Tax=Hexamita inflata TaxID=28002 RepID=A0AA86Q7T5_9EUKA|nr:Hypothetical protein HINF_LOCUS39941 [Hexamita inflata]